MTRQFVLVFMGEPRWDAGVHPHESPRTMTLPLIVLAGLSIVGGFLNTPFRMALEHFLEPSFEVRAMSRIPPRAWACSPSWPGSRGSVRVWPGPRAAFLTYNRPAELWRRFEAAFGRIWRLWQRATGSTTSTGPPSSGPGRRLAEDAAFRFDIPIIDGLVNGAGRLVRAMASTSPGMQTGMVRSYGAVFAAGTIWRCGLMLIWRGDVSCLPP